ncbi:hypothetical protein EG329_006707 [Mollisiaceae sp. DMI_Dod_QoI]|nr:hypothetical protein EG329_006707 [Helotiales sp. DMI_Dod_QoI]
MVESSVATFEAFCENHDGASLSADQEYLHQYEEIVRMYASFASTRQQAAKPPVSAPVAMRWRSVGLEAIKSVASSEALASLAGRQLDVIVPILLENLWTDNEDFIDVLEHRVQLEEKIDTEKLLRRRTSVATVRTADTATEANAAALSGTTADADKVAEEDIGVLAMQCLKQIFVVNNRSQIHGATLATLRFIADRVAQHEQVIDEKSRAGHWRGWATRIFELIARWTPVQDRYVILVTTLDTLTRTEIAESTMQQQLVLATMIDSLLKSDINLIGLSVMDVLLGLIQKILKLLQLDTNQGAGAATYQDVSGSTISVQASMIPTHLRKELTGRLQDCIGDLATHVYYADQISDMVAAILLRLKPPTMSSVPNAVAAIENPNGATVALASSGNLAEDPATDGFFSLDTAKIMALEAIKAILIVASNKDTLSGVASLGRNRVPVRVWEGTQWLLRDGDGRVRKAYVDALLTWLEREVTRSDLRVFEEKSKALSKSNRNDSGTNLTKRAVSNASHREKPAKNSRTTFLQLLHLAVYENAIQYVYYEEDIVLLHLLLATLVENLGVNAVRNGLPMIFRLQEDILEAETPIAKIRIGSLCHGYFWFLSEKFEFDTSPVGRAIQNEIRRRQSKMFWTDRVTCPPIGLDKIGTPGESLPSRALPLREIETEALRPFDDRYQMVTLISLSYSASLSSPPTSAPASPGRSFSHPILNSTAPISEEEHSMPEKVKEQMMSEWSRDFVIAIAQEGSKTVSLNGSRSGTNITTGHRNFLAVNGNNNGGTNSGSQSPKGHGNIDLRGRPTSSSYGLVGGLGALQKLRKSNGQSLGPTSDSSRNSVTRVDTLKRVLSGHQSSAPATRMGAHSDGSSESMVSYDFTTSEVSYNPPPPNVPIVERSASMRGSNERARSKSRDRVASAGEHSRPLSSHPIQLNLDSDVPRESEEDVDAVPPVPPLPSSLAGDGTAAQDHTLPEMLRKGRSVKRSEKMRPGLIYQGSSSWGDEGGPSMNLESLLKGIDAGETDQRGNVVKPPY